MRLALEESQIDTIMKAVESDDMLVHEFVDLSVKTWFLPRPALRELLATLLISLVRL